jgi:hypothetical protein
MKNLDHLWEMRLVSMGGLSFAAWALCGVLRHVGWDLLISICVAIMACTVPATQVYATWAIFFPNPYGVVAAIMAGWLAGWILDGARWRYLLTPIAAMLLVTSLITYQPAGMVFVPIMLLFVFSPPRRDDSLKLKIGRLAFFQAINAAALLGGYLTLRLGLHIYPRSASIGRTGITPALLHKPAWFVNGPLREAMNLWNLPPIPIVAWTVGGVLAIGLFLYFSGDWRNRLLLLVICALAIPLAYVPNLLAEDADAYRTHIGMSWTLLVLGLFAFTSFWQSAWKLWQITLAFLHRPRQPGGIAPAIPGGFLILAAAAAAFSAAYTSTVYLTWPHAVELADLRMQMAKPNVAAADHLIFLQIMNWNDTAAPHWLSDDFGCPSIANDLEWEPQGAAYMIRREANRNAAIPDVQMIPFYQSVYSQPLPPDTALIDMRHLSASK